MAHKVFKLLYRFDAEDSEELSVAAGARVLLLDDSLANREGWVFVETVDLPRKSGFVPAEYLGPDDQPPASHPAHATRDITSYSPGPSHLDYGASARLGESSFSQSRPLAASALASTPAPQSGADPEDFSHLFASHEDWFQQAAHKRAEGFQDLMHSIDALDGQMQQSQEKNAVLIQRLTQLDDLINDERVKWQDKVDQDKSALAALPASRR